MWLTRRKCRHSLLPVCPVAVMAALLALPWLRPAGPRNACTQSSLVPIGADLLSLASTFGGRWSAEAAAFIRLFAGHVREARPLRNRQRVLQPLSRGGLGFSLSQLRVPSQPACCPFPSPTLPNLDGEPPLLSDVLADLSEVPMVPPLASRLWSRWGGVGF